LISSRLRFLFLAQSAILLQPSPSDLLSVGPDMISILRIRSEKLLSLNAKAKFGGALALALYGESDSMNAPPPLPPILLVFLDSAVNG
jgi:hypothetical protein